jgi:multidrug transporter EmrE-like cation transporter
MSSRREQLNRELSYLRGPKIPWLHFARSNYSSRMTTSPAAVVMFVMAALLGAIGQFLYKSGAEQAGGSLASYLLNVRLLGGVACYVAVMVLFVAAFKRGGALTVLYPIYATTFIWAAIIARFAYATPIRPANIGGMALLIAGMYFMGR